ncbi:argonaute/piwi family protein [Flavobacterium seoulense]|uniref:Protein argonaute n=1 Tax=Flavobacterium seoulense TaxID=1492738 RepID=A0A066WTI0_9FLAO|nr:hypothetical protein [Flavobacterium seoulense]KDN55853.1 hypothetical protein FEM21_10440 [Flavobacterium seoulense]
MTEAFLTTRRGFVQKLTLTRYDYLNWIIESEAQKAKLKNWLKNKSGFLTHEIEDTCFFTFERLLEESTKQYRASGEKTLSAPFKNTQLISNLIGTILKKELSKKYKQFFSQNIFIVSTIDLYPFNLLKAFEFNIEVFDSGHFLIHVNPVSKIVSSKVVDKEYLDYLKKSNLNNSKTTEMEFAVINHERNFRLKFDLLDECIFEKIEKLHSEKNMFTATFDYHFLANFSPEIFGKIVEHTSKDLKQAIMFLNDILSNIKLPSFLNLHEERYFKVNISELDRKNNLLIGSSFEVITIYSKSQTQYGLRIEFTRDSISRDELITIFLKNEELIEKLNDIKVVPATINAKIEQKTGWKNPYITNVFIDNVGAFSTSSLQSASYFHGIYKAVNNWNILPIVYEDLDIKVFENLMLHAFNKNATEFKILEPIIIKSTNEIDKQEVQRSIKNQAGKTMIAVFCKYKIPHDSFAPLKGFKYQIYQGDTTDNKQNRAKLSNFTCKCLEKMGGVIAAIADTSIAEDGYFIGIDLGHTTNGKEKFSNLGVSLFDSLGILLGDYVEKEIPRRENLIDTNCLNAFKKLDKMLEAKKLNKPKHLIIHRDGKLHFKDINILVSCVETVWGKINVDIVEIIKSGFPVMAIKDETNKPINPISGTSYQDDIHKYAILATNVQADEQSAVINPIIIKHKYGELEFSKIVEQVYWFTKVYTNNLYNSTRLPATTLKANNVVGTSKKLHRSTYLG